MTHLRQIMLEELRRRNFAETTIRSYLHGVEHFSSTLSQQLPRETMPKWANWDGKFLRADECATASFASSAPRSTSVDAAAPAMVSR